MQQQSLKQKSELHLSRKVWHFTTLALVALVFNLVPMKLTWLFEVVACAAIIPIDVMRLRRPKLNDFALKIFGPLMRRHEYDRLSGMTYLLIGLAYLLLLHDRHVITLTVLFLAVGDPIASYCGIKFGKDRIVGQKTLQGSFGAFAACTVIALAYCYFSNIMVERVLIVAPLAGLIGAASELTPIGKLDDNLTFPIMASTLLWLLFKVYGGLGI
jgi:dolichol kinase